MAASQTGLRLRFFTWEKPLLGQAVEYLTASALAQRASDAGGNEVAGVSVLRALDLSAQLVVVPTQQAGRRLREALAAGASVQRATRSQVSASGEPAVAATYAAAPSTALFPPLVLTFDALLEVLGEASAGGSAVAGAGASAQIQHASPSQVLLAWVDVLLSAELEAFRAVFPGDPPARNFSWARGMAEQLASLQDELRENGLGLVEVAARLEPDFPEFARWQELAELERRQCARLADFGLAGPLEAQRELLAQGRLPAGIERVVVLAWPDPRPMVLGFLERVAQVLPVEICVYAAESERDHFDGWGRPIPEKWAARELQLPDFAARVRVCADPHEQAERLADTAALYTREGANAAQGSLALGVLDAEILRPLETALRERGVPSFNPTGSDRRGDRLHQLLCALAAFAREDSFQNLARLARQPDVLLALFGATEGTRFLAELDGVYERHLPPDLSALRAKWRSVDRAGTAALKRLGEWREVLRRGDFSAAGQAVLAQIFQGRSFDLSVPEDAEWVAAAEVWAACLREVAEAVRLCPALGGDERFASAVGGEREGGEAFLALAIECYARKRVFGEKPAGAVELQGWLELIWADAPHLVVAGLNEGKVPASVSGDLFLPESLRAKLGLKTNVQRFAVDAYYLQSLAASRVGAARLDVLFGRVSAKGDPLKPSRLLLRCEEEDLPQRVQFLFREPPPRGGAALAWSRAWTLQLPDPSEVELPLHLPVTGLRAWLACPLRFYLSRVLKLRPVDAAKVEMDARDFGTLCHAALEAMGREEALRGCTDALRLQRFLREALDAAVARQFGRRLSVPLRVQVESARQRLDALAVEQARLHAEGWRIKRVEWEFELPIGELVFRGKIDRIDEHEASGALRVIDYKTSDTAESPERVHLVSLPKGAELPAWRLFQAEEGKKPRAWADLQLPIYERVCAGEFSGRPLRCGYFNLPRAVADTALSLWEDYTQELTASAWGCAVGVAAAIARREFWPPRELKPWEARRDEFATLFQRGAADSISFARKGEEAAAL